MNEADSNRLADLVRLKIQLSERIEKLPENEANDLHLRLREVTEEGFKLMANYFRQTLYPILKRKFPHDLDHSETADGNQVSAFSELMQDCFCEIHKKFDDEQWVFRCPVELRNLAAQIIQRDIIDEIRARRRRAKLHPDYFILKQLSADAQQLLAEEALEFEPVMLVLERWDLSGTKEQQRHARILRLYYLFEFNMREVAHDLGIEGATAYKHKDRALDAIRKELAGDVK